MIRLNNKQIMRVGYVVGMLEGCTFISSRSWRGMFDPEVSVDWFDNGMVVVYAIDPESREYFLVATILPDGQIDLNVDTFAH